MQISYQLFNQVMREKVIQILLGHVKQKHFSDNLVNKKILKKIQKHDQIL